MPVVHGFAVRPATAERRAAARQRLSDVRDIEQLELYTAIGAGTKTEQQFIANRVQEVGKSRHLEFTGNERIRGI